MKHPTAQVDPEGFPLKLLKAPTPEKVDYFERYLVRHPNLDAVDRAIWRGINHKPGPSLYFVIGPTGVGKTTLRESLQRRLDLNAPTVSADGRRWPNYLSCEIAAPESGYMNWRDFYRNLLEPLETEFLKERLGEKASKFHLIGRAAYSPRGSLADYRETLIEWFKESRPPALFIDETQHLVSLSSGRLMEHLDVLKSFATRAKTKMVLFGTYQLLPGRNLNAQLSRRSVDLHFPRYGLSDRDTRAFDSILWSFQRHLPLRFCETLTNHADLLYARSVGCVGILKNWLTWALEMAWEENRGRLTLDLLKSAAPNVKVSSRIADEAIEGEKLITDETGSEEHLYEILGMSAPKKQIETPMHPMLETEIPKMENRKGNAKKKTRSSEPDLKVLKTVSRKPRLPHSIGKRNPKRDPVGKG